MQLSKFNIKNANTKEVSLPAESLFELPEKVLQFGTGVLLRGLPDYYIDKANRQGIFNGRIVMVKSTANGGSEAFEKQDNLYTLCVRGMKNGKNADENIICSSISRVLSAKDEWDIILECAHNPQLQVIISNTTEVGIQLVHDDIRKHPPVSYPGKLLAFLQERYRAFAGSQQSGLVIVPTELITDNGKKLESIVLELAHLNALDEKFIEWVEKYNYFCNSLVDRIVPGKPDAAAKTAIEEKLGYTDDLLTFSEAYSLWAIEGDEHIKEILSFAKADESVIITPDINLHRELKLRLLNGTHTLSCGVAFLSGISTVKEGMDDKNISAFIERLMLNDIARAIPYTVSGKVANTFGKSVLERFANGQIQHYWLSITLNYTAKLKMRALPVLHRYYEIYGTVPENFATSFAAYLLFMKAVKADGGKYYGNSNGKEYPINDEMAGYFYKLWLNNEPAALVVEVLQDTDLWETNLASLPGFAAAVTEKLLFMMESGVLHTLQAKKVMAE